jgi:hypothetical protein
MSITQTVDIPASHRLTIDVPREVPAGPVILTFTPKSDQRSVDQRFVEKPIRERVFGCSKGKYRMADDFDDPLEAFKDYM